MIFDVGYWSKVLKRLLVVLGTLVLLFFSFKLLAFYLPFLIAFIIALILEPVIRFLNKKIKLNRKISSVLVVLIVFIALIALIVWGIFALIGEATNFLSGINEHFDKIYNISKNFIESIDLEKFQLSDQVSEVIQNSTHNLLTEISNFIKNLLTGTLSLITSLPRVGITIIITVLATLFICMDRVYIMEQVKHHMPEVWVKKVGTHIKEIISELGNYLKAQLILISITFCEVLIGMFILNLLGFDIEYPLLAGLAVGVVDALPILGAGTVLTPWAIISAVNGNLSLAIALLVLYIIIIVVRQLIEPKIVSKQIGIHPIFTLLAMYTGFKLMGFLGLLAGPIAIIICKNIFKTLIEKGVFKSIFAKR